MGSEWSDFEVQGRRCLQLLIDDEDWDSVTAAVVAFWERLFSEADAYDWSAMYIRIQPDYGFNFYLHSETATEKPTEPMMECPRFELEITRMESDFLDHPDEKHPELREAAWRSIEQALKAESVWPRFTACQEAGRLIRGGEWDGKDGYPRQIPSE